MTIPNGPDHQGRPGGPAQPQPPYNPKPSLWSSVPRSVLAGGAAAVVAVVVVLVIVVTGGGGDNDGAGAVAGAEAGTSTSTTPASKFVPDLFDAAGSHYDKKTDKRIAPPQRIAITGSLDLTEWAESIGYGAAEQRLPKNGQYVATDSSFPTFQGTPQVSLFTDKNNVLHLSWSCQFIPNDPDNENCQEVYRIAFDVSGSEPAMLTASNSIRDRPSELLTAIEVTNSLVAVADLSQLPASARGTDKWTGADTVSVLAASQPREGSTKVYFVVPDSLKLYFGELEPSR
ncbi:hypothetical protein [Prescottella subtropica]|uniref:hypothetical protein n=1 Tax=Prescottella subtropica TaxID=2545757 RepID=UPI0010F93428|nr:hypothetical protein [Prescottella subtropica]